MLVVGGKKKKGKVESRTHEKRIRRFSLFMQIQEEQTSAADLEKCSERRSSEKEKRKDSLCQNFFRSGRKQRL